MGEHIEIWLSQPISDVIGGYGINLLDTVVSFAVFMLLPFLISAGGFRVLSYMLWRGKGGS